jgi:hypothetical protein
LDGGGVDPVSGQESIHLAGIPGELSLSGRKIVPGAHVAEGPERQVGGDLPLGQALYLDVPGSSPAGGESLADEEPADGDAQRQDHCRPQGTLH